MIDSFSNGLGWPEFGLLLNRIAVGTFFMLSGYHKLFNAQRHRELKAQLESLHIPAVKINEWWVPFVEFSAGTAVVGGLFAPLAAVGLIVVIVIAAATTGRARVDSFKPIDAADRLDDWLYLPESLYMFMLLTVVMAGAGGCRLDSFILDPLAAAQPARY